MNQYKVAIVGAGAAGFVTAAAIKRNHPDVQVEIIYDPKAPTIGVGESLGFFAKSFFNDTLGLKDHLENEWMTQAGAVDKYGILFNGWNGSNSTMYLGKGPVPWKYNEYDLVDLWAHAYRKGILNQHSFNFDYDFTGIEHDMHNRVRFRSTYHIDAGKLGPVIHRLVGIPAGVKEIKIPVKAAVTKDGNTIDHIILSDDSVYIADLYIDCTGFSRVLAKELPFKLNECGEHYNNSVLVGQYEYQNSKEFRPWSTLTSMDDGWCFGVSLAQRSGNGYVYNSNFVTDENKLVEEFEKKTGMKNVIGRKISWRPGYYDRACIGNCIVIGLGFGMIDPFDANVFTSSLKFISFLVDHRLPVFCRSDNSRWQDEFNSYVSKVIDHIRLRIDTAFHLAPRSDTAYWQRMKQVAIEFDTLNRLNDYMSTNRYEQYYWEHNNKSDYFRLCLYYGIDPQMPITADSDHKTQSAIDVLTMYRDCISGPLNNL